ncbi:MAG: hypothetical protein ABW071_03815, partial [Casimicrobiaceae bacterium]
TAFIRPLPQRILTPAGLLLDEDLRETETTAGKILRVVVPDERHAFLAHFRQIDLPSHLREIFRIDFHPRRLGLLVLMLGLWIPPFLADWYRQAARLIG